MDRITILGLGPIGVSIGLALKRAGLKDTEILGTDPDGHAMSRASEMGAIDVASGNLRSAMKDAQLVIMDTPLAETQELLEAIGPILEEGCVVTDTGSVKVQVIEWAESYLARGTSFVGGRPLPSRSVTNAEDADASLFDGTRYCLVSSESTNTEALRTVVGMVEILGAKPLFLDAHEYDSYAAAVVHLPLVLSSALVSSTTSSASWVEMFRLAKSEFEEVSKLADLDPRDNAAACRANPEALIHWLDQVIAELHVYRDEVERGGDELEEKFIDAWEERAKWEADTVVEEGRGASLPGSATSMGGVFLGKRILDRSQRIFDLTKRPKWKYSKRS